MLVLATSVGISTQASAEEDQVKSREGWYGDLTGVKSNADNGLLDADLDASFGISLGYDFEVANNFVTGIEIEYIDYGSRDIGDATARTNSGNVVSVDIEEGFTAINVNIRPKYYVVDGFFLGGLVGFGSIEYSQELAKTGYQSYTLNDESDSAINYGLEAGYEFDSGWSIRAGARMTSMELNNRDVDITTKYIGLGYKF